LFHQLKSGLPLYRFWHLFFPPTRANYPKGCPCQKHPYFGVHVVKNPALHPRIRFNPTHSLFLCGSRMGPNISEWVLSLPGPWSPRMMSIIHGGFPDIASPPSFPHTDFSPRSFFNSENCLYSLLRNFLPPRHLPPTFFSAVTIPIWLSCRPVYEVRRALTPRWMKTGVMSRSGKWEHPNPSKVPWSFGTAFNS